MNASANFALILVEHMYKLNTGITLKHFLSNGFHRHICLEIYSYILF